MGDVAIRVEGLGKKYPLIRQQQGRTTYKTLQEDLRAAMRWPLTLLREGRQRQTTREEFAALNDVSFEVKHGEVLGIIGHNGAGKSTLLKVLSRITEPSSGHADIYGRIGSLLEVGTGFHPELTGRENIYLNGAILGMRREEIRRKFDEIVAFAEVEQFLDTPVKRYSSGMYMRLAFAVAAHLEPEILIIDEVLAVGDAAFQKKCLGKMQEVAHEGRTVLFVSHQMNAVEQLCTSGLLLAHGEVKQYSRQVKAVIREYMSPEGAEENQGTWINIDGQRYDSQWLTPLRFGLVDDHHQPLVGPVGNNASIWVEIELNVKQPDPALSLGYALYSEDGTLLYWSYQTDRSEEHWPILDRGRYLLRSEIPRRLINEGTYRLELATSLHFRQWLCQPGVDAPSITLAIQGELSDSPYWMAKRHGTLAPVLPWQTEKRSD